MDETFWAIVLLFSVKITSIAPSDEIFRLAFYMHNVYHPTDWWLIFRINYRLLPKYV